MIINIVNVEDHIQITFINSQLDLIDWEQSPPD